MLKTLFASDQQRTQITRTVSYYVSFITLGSVVAIVGPALPSLADNTNSTKSQIGLIFTANAIGYLLGTLLAGRVFDRVPGHPVMVMALLVIAATLIVIPLASLLWVLIVIFFITGLASSELDVGGNTMLLWTHPKQVDAYMSGLHFFFGAGTFLAPIIVAQAILINDDIRLAYWTLAVLILPATLLLARVSSPTPRHAKVEVEDESSNTLLIVLLVIFFFLHVGIEVGYGSWLFSYATQLDLAGEATAAYMTSAFWGSFTLGRLLSIPLATRFVPQTVLLLNLIGSLLSIGLILVSSHVTVLWIGTCGLGLSIAPLFAAGMSYAEKRLTMTGRTTSWFFVGTGVGMMALPWGIGVLFETTGPRAMMWAIAASAFGATAIFVATVRYTSTKVRRMASLPDQSPVE